jgi:hypothetical protein
MILGATRRSVDPPILRAAHARQPALVAVHPRGSGTFVAKRREIPYCC